MSGLALLFLKSGCRVSGSDIREGKVTEELKSRGIEIFTGHSADNIRNQDLVVYSSAIRQDNPEMLQARRLGIALIKRAQALAQLMGDKTAITVAGSHGKTTTTSLASFMLMEAGLCPTAAIGGILKNIAANACLGKSDFFVAEADESDGSFLYYQPRYSIITNIDCEHLDYYQNFDNEIKAFASFINKTKTPGCVFACYDDANLRGILRNYRGKHSLYGLSGEADIYAKNIKFKGLSSQFDCFLRNKSVGKFNLSLGGKHNVQNALAVIALGLQLGIDLKVIQASLEKYQGALRRLEVKFRDDQYTLIDDYAHHPTEIKATLSALRQVKAKRKIGIFQPHRYSRTKLLLNEFTAAFDDLDTVIITDIYPASELPIAGIDAQLLLGRIKQEAKIKDAVYLPKDKIIDFLKQNMLPGDLLITLGAGDIARLSDALAAMLKGQD